VTNTEEKLNKKENELRQVAEHLTHLREEHDSLKTEHQQLISDKMLITEQLRAEQDLCAETEEVLCAFYIVQNTTFGFGFGFVFCIVIHQIFLQCIDAGSEGNPAC